jgi:hypothetical protein
VYDPIIDLEEINTKCRNHLAKLLNARHGIRVGVVGAEGLQTGSRGSAFFLAFDPWDTCLRFPPGSFKYFDMAQRAGLVTAAEAVDLSRTLIASGIDYATRYQGHFRSFFDEPRVRNLLDQIDDLEHLAASGLDVGAHFVDRLSELSPIPLIPERHLESRSFQNVKLMGEVQYFAGTLWLAWAEAIDLISLGPWVGFRAQEVTSILNSLNKLALENRLVDPCIEHDIILGEKIAIPFFSNGLQGVVVGFFHGIDGSQKQLMYTTLIQYGQTLADAYAGLRMQRLAVAFGKHLHLDGLAREILHVVSPVKKLILSRERGRIGYGLKTEHNYWAGYRRLTAAPDFERDTIGFSIDSPNGVAIYIEPLTDVPNFHHQFTHIRVEMCLRQCFGAGMESHRVNALSNGHLSDLHSVLSAVVEEQSVSLAKLRQFYIISRIQAQWESGRVNVTNFEMKQFLERELGKEVKTGYQVTSYVSEIEKMFDNRVEIRKTRNSLSISWNVA